MKKVLEDFNINYLIYDNGQVWSRKNNIKLKTRIDKYGYEVLTLRDAVGKKHNLFIHRLVAKYFLENSKSLPQVNHKDGNKLNNNLNNLEWCTTLENQRHKREFMLTSSKKLYVHFNTTKKRWIAQPTICGKRIYKTFKTEEEAIKYLEASDPIVVNQKMN